MEKNRTRLAITSVLLGVPFVCLPAAYAARVVDLGHQSVGVLQPYVTAKPSLTKEAIRIEEVRRSTDLNKTLHVRVQQMYAGYPVFGGEAIIHVPNGQQVNKDLKDVISASQKNGGSVDGNLYEDLTADLNKAPNFIYSPAQAQKALREGLNKAKQGELANAEVRDEKSELMVFVDDAPGKDGKLKAHWAYKVSFNLQPNQIGVMPSKPVYILDAVTFQPYAKWDEIMTLETDAVLGGGFGGNLKMGKMIYDGLEKNLAKLNVTRDDSNQTCYLKNKDVQVLHYGTSRLASFKCEQASEEHNKLFWDEDLDTVNGGYSPDNDALFGGDVIKSMYQNWYNVPVLEENGKPMLLTMVVHDKIDNAYWDGRKMTFGDGRTMFYPLTSLGVAAHEISHGFTQQHSNLAYYGQSGGMNEAYSDMAAQAAEIFAYGKNSWQIGPEIFKKENEALRYMDQPSKDCKGKKPGSWCSIDTADQYTSGLDVHYSSGVFNHFFYILANKDGWDTRKAFDVMVAANMKYWTSRSTFSQGACGTLKAAKDLSYNLDDVADAFTQVAIDTSKC